MPIAVLGIVIAMITPMPPFLLDILISANITISVIVLLVSMYITRPVEFSVFPTSLLLLTLFRLALNISSSRLILIRGNTGTRAAGQVIEAFGNFVVGGNYIIGVVIFLVLIAIQYVVINHGAVRISEVTARFTLDALPGKQMSIDSDLNAGLIDEGEARQRRKMLAAEAEFYGAMDGASRFTQRDAVASILITTINIVAGFLIGVLQNGMDLKQALSTYTVLTIGDGLVTVIPALMVSVSGGMIITRTSSEEKLGEAVRHQIFDQPQPLMLSGGVLIALAAFPGLPTIPFLLLGSGVGYSGWRLRQKNAAAVKALPSAGPPQAKENLESLLKVEPLAVEVGLGLVRMVEGGQNSPLLRRIAGIRRQMATELGYMTPPVRVTDNLQLKASEYVVLLKGAEIARYEIPQNHELAIHPGGSSQPSVQSGGGLPGIATREPAFNIPAIWIAPETADLARQQGYTVVDAVSVLGTHLAELIRRHASELLSRQETKTILDRVAEDNPKVIEDLVPKLLPLATVQKVFQNLLRERVSIRDSVTILEALGEAGAMTKNPILLTEYSRQAIRRILVKPYLNANGELPAFFVDPQMEQT
ncbi:MAG TPA: flagellar biosynthesis protein FlhA, partial [Bryobacteraceae bacterium]|nr:flagellar biosynthesis protein FlhA [Bryobacteraceae bacterium]